MSVFTLCTVHFEHIQKTAKIAIFCKYSLLISQLQWQGRRRLTFEVMKISIKLF
jgi:hypothetical protein